MSILDSKGRLFGKVSILDVGAALVILLVIVGVLVPSLPGGAQIGTATKPVEIDVIVRGFDLKNPRSPLKAGDKTSIVVRNQTYGNTNIKSIQELPRTVAVPQPNGSVKALPDPRPEAAYYKDFLVTLGGDAVIKDDGPVLGNVKVKSGLQVELQGFDYDYPTLNILAVRVLDRNS